MDKIKEFIINNKAIMVSSVIFVLIVIIVVAVVMLSSEKDNNEKKNITKETTTLSKETDNEDKATAETVTTDETKELEGTKETESSEATTEENTTEEQTTVPVTPIEYPYTIKINRIANCVTVYGKDANGEYTVPVKAMTVSCGKIIDDTPLGDFNTVEWYKWGMMFDGSYAQYAYRIVESILFHSVPYYTLSNGELDWEEYNKLGTSASHGCVRMTVADAKWLVENCPVGTTVMIYDDASNPGPLGKPDTIKIPMDSPYRGWDPTDPNPNNPWHQFSTILTYPVSKVITVDEGCSESKLKSYFTAKDKCGNDISDKVMFSGEYNLKVAGTYKNVLVSVTDATGSYAEVNVSIIVKAKEVPTTETTTLVNEEETTTSKSEEETTSEMETSTETVSTEIYNN